MEPIFVTGFLAKLLKGFPPALRLQLEEFTGKHGLDSLLCALLASKLATDALHKSVAHALATCYASPLQIETVRASIYQGFSLAAEVVK